MVFAVVGLIALVGWAGLWWMRRHGFTSEGPIRVVATRSLGGKRLLALVEIEGGRFLLGMTDEQIACLARLDTPATAHRVRQLAAGGEAS
jgi:flagellar biogenesis protein FliO